MAAAGEGGGRAAARPADIPGRGWWDILRRVRRSLASDHIWVAAAGVAFCTLFAAIPGVAVLVAAYAILVDPAAAHRQLEMTGGLLPAAVGAVPLSPGAAAAVTLARWPALAVLMAAALAVLYRFAP